MEPRALAVALEHVHVSQQMMREQHRLRSLQVGVAGHDHIEVILRGGGESAPQSLQAGEDVFHLIAQIKPHIQGHLIVTASPGMDFATGSTDQLD